MQYDLQNNGGAKIRECNGKKGRITACIKINYQDLVKVLALKFG